MPLSDPSAAWRAPRLQVTANGELVLGAMEAEVISTNYYGADRFNIRVALGLDAWAGAAFWSGASNIVIEVLFSLDGGASFTSLIQGVADNVSIDHTLGVVNIDGRDRSAALVESLTQETFANRTSSEIASLLAGRHGLTPCVSSTSTPVGRYYQNEHQRTTLDQFSRATTEWDLLVFLARHEGFDVFVRGQALYFQPKAQATDLTITLRPQDVLDLRLARSLTLARDIEVLVRSWNSRHNSAFTQQARSACQVATEGSSGDPQRYVFVRPNLTPDDALKFAQNKLDELTRHERTIRISMPGELVLTPRSMLALEGTNTDFDQAYFIDVIERRLRNNSGMTQYILARNASPRVETVTSANAAGAAA